MPDPFTELLGSGTPQCRQSADDLEALAREAVEATRAHDGEPRIVHAVANLRDRTRARYELREYINAVKAAVATADARDHPSAKAERAAVVAFLRGMDLHRLAERIAAGEHHG